MKFILRRLLIVIRKGSFLSDGLRQFPYTFSEFFVNMIRIGEESGTLETNLTSLAVKLKKDHELVTKIRSALMYPVIIVIALGGLGLALALIVLPKLMIFFKSLDVEIPLTTRVFIATADFIQGYWHLTIVGVAALVILVVVINKLPRTKKITHWIVYNLPIFKAFSRTSNLANICRSMNLLLKSGIPIDESLVIMGRAVNNVLYQKRLQEVLELVKKGDRLSEVMARYPHYFPAIITRMLHVGELSGNLAETFEYLAEFYEDELDVLSKNLSTIIEPALLIIIGILVGFFALAIISPIYQLTGGLRA